MQKRGELTSGQIATLSIAIAGFIIALIFLLYILDVKDFSQREVCRLSVLTRATSPDALQRLTPLKCTTEKICLTKNNDCNQFIGEKDVVKIKVETKEEIEKVVADSMYDCWSMMGQGKLDIFGGKKSGFLNSLNPLDVFGNAKTTCLMCARISLSKDLLEDDALMNSVNVNEYMETHQVPGSELTYLQTFTDQQVRSYPREFRDSLGKIADENQTDQISIIFMQILTQSTPLEAGTQTALEAGGFVFTATSGLGPFGRLLSWKLVAGLTAAAAIGGGTLAGIQTWRNQQVSAGYCGEFTSVDAEKNKGCSVVTPFDYNKVDAIKNYCSKLEGST